MEEKTDKVVGYIEYLGAGGMPAARALSRAVRSTTAA